MRLLILLIAVISIALAKTENVERSVRAPQGQITYSDSDGSRVNWEYLPPQNQLRLQRANAQRSQRAEGGSPHRLRQAQQSAPQHRAPAPQPQQVQQAQNPQYYSYKPYSAVPSHIRQLIDSIYQPQAPYVDPTSFLYGGNYFAAAPQQQREQQPAPAASEIPSSAYLQPAARYQSIDPQRAQSRYSDRRVERQDRVVYKEDYEQLEQQQQQQQQLQQQQQQVAALGAISEPPITTLYLDRNMPTELKQLLKYQAQIPYDVTANRIQYRPKSIFIPKPLSDDVKGSYYYRSKVYYTNDDNVDTGNPQEKPVEEQRH